MARLVLKFGGTSVADIERIRVVARHVKREVDAGHEVAVVVSAMAGTTNQLVAWCKDASRLHDAREYDAVVSAGEQITSGLLAIALSEMGVPARSWLGWQIPIRTSNVHGAARIEKIETDALEKAFAEGRVAVVAGFQGLADNNRIATLGRGGSDTSAVALAAALGADRCDIYTDVDGVYTTDPRMTPRARKLEKVTYEEMLEMASQGAKVLQTRSVGLAMVHQVRTLVRSSFDDPDDAALVAASRTNTGLPGTLVCDEEEIVEQELVTGIAYSRDEAKITLVKVADKPGIAAAIFGPLAEAGINVDMIVQNVSEGDAMTDLTFTVSHAELDKARAVVEAASADIGYQQLIADGDVAKISVIGVGMRSHTGVAQKMFHALADRGINLHVISTSEIKVSVLIDAEYTELAVRALHTAYGLDGDTAA
ncbi:aspartate kinase [Pyruvatibacter sp.]|uniref:aspartate kinase n=1 Tax=Pyruvatibacter sp. TaxID=1981328 RepID=UPI0032EEAB32